MSRSCALLLIVVFAVLASPAFAVTNYTYEEWQEFEQLGIADAKRAELELIQQKAILTPLQEHEIVSGIERDYGLPVSRSAPGAPAGSLRVNLDGNDVIDERDILELGFTPARTVSSTVPIGTGADAPKLLVLMIKFPDQEPTNKTLNISNARVNDGTHNVAWSEDHWFDLTAPADLADTSVSYYYQTASYGKFEVQGDVYNNADFGGSVADSNGWITSTYNRAAVDGSPSFADVVEDALTQINDYVDFSDYDSNQDGFMDGLIIVYAGQSSTSGEFWHFRWINIYMEADDTMINSGVWTGEEARIGTFVHEFGHELGLPDLYDTGGTPAMPGSGYWGVMGSWWTNQSIKPPLPNAWERMKLRFVEPVNVATTTSPTAVTINRATASSPLDTVYRIWRNGYWGKEYFLVEFRDTNHGFDASLFGSGGLLIWHIDENRTTATNRDNAYDPQRVWLECASDVGDPMDSGGDQAWRSGNNGDDSVDYFADSTTPNAHDNDDAVTGVLVDPTSDTSGTTMTFELQNASGSGLPTLSWTSPSAGATVSGSTTMSVSSNANDRVDFYVNDCLKNTDSTAPFSFSWDTQTSLDGETGLRAIAYNSSGTDPVRVIDRTVTVNNSGTGLALPFTDNFNSYSSGTSDNDLLGQWNLHEDQMGLNIRVHDSTNPNWNSNAIVFAETSFPSAASGDDPNAGIYQGQDDNWLMSPRLKLNGYSSLDLEFDLSFRSYFSGEAIMLVQISTDDGASWDQLEGLSYFRGSSTPYYVGCWGMCGSGDYTFWADRTISLDSYLNEEAYIRFYYHGGRTYSVGMALDNISIDGTAISLQVNSVTPQRGVVGDSVTIDGAGFHATQGAGQVRFNNGAGGYVVAPIISWSNIQIDCNIPSGAASDPTAGVWVYQDSIDSNKLGFTVVLDAPTAGSLDQL